MMIERLLRAVAIVIAVLALVDPALTLSWREPATVGVAVVDARGRASAAGARGRSVQTGAGDTARAGAASEAAARVEAQVEAQVVAALARDFDVRTGIVPDAAAQVLIGGGRYPTGLALPDAVRASAVLLAPTGAAARITRVDAPADAHLSSRVPVITQIEGQGLAGRASTVVLSANGLEVARATHTWRSASERVNLTLETLPFTTGPVRLTAALLEARAAAAARKPGTRSSGNAGVGDVPAPGAPTGAPSTRDAATPAMSDAAASIPTPAAAATPGASVIDAADVVVDVHDRPLRILVLNARPSWAAQFIGRALQEDPRFAVSTATRISRGVTTSSPGAPTSLTAFDPQAFQAIIVGAPELLTRAEVDTLRSFARVRGGAVVIAPDRRPEGPVLDLLPARDFAERLLPEAQALVPTARGAPDSTARPADGPLWASEVAVPGRLLPGTDVLLHLANASPDTAGSDTAGSDRRGAAGGTDAVSARGGRPSASRDTRSESRAKAGAATPIVIASPLGEGSILLSGALDAWRFRDRRATATNAAAQAGGAAQAGDATAAGSAAVASPVAAAPVAASPVAAPSVVAASAGGGPSETRFDRFWRDTIAARAAAAPDPITVTLHPALAGPGDPVAIRVRVHRVATASQPHGDSPSAVVRATLNHAPGAEPGAASGAGDGAPTPIRLWPGERPNAYDGVLNAPTGVGVYAVSVEVDGQRAAAERTLRVIRDVHPVRADWRGLRAFVEARGGVAVTPDEIDRLASHLRQSVRPIDTRRPRHPLRSAWWILPFAACLGGEWFFRRRRGAR